jgi:acetyl-CoA synthase
MIQNDILPGTVGQSPLNFNANKRTGLCGSYNWMDCKAAYEINPTGANQPVPKGDIIDKKLGQFKGVNEFITKASRGKIDHYYFYSIVHDP